MKPITRFHSTGITPGWDFFFHKSGCTEFAKGNKGRKKSVDREDKKLGFYQCFKI